MKGRLDFNLEDKDDTMAHKRCVKSLEMAIVLFELQYNLGKNIDSYLEQLNPEPEQLKDFVLDRINGLLEENNIVIDDLIE